MLDPPALASDVPVTNMDLGRLRETGELLMRRLGGDNAGRGFAQVPQAHGEPALIERMKLHETGPSLVEHHVIAKAADPRDNAFGVVNRAVIGALFDHRGAERTLALPRFLVRYQGVVANALAYPSLVKIFRANGTDQPVGVAVGREVDRNAATHQQRSLVRGFMVVAIEQ